MSIEITPAYVRKMAAYNRWMNEGIYSAAASLSDTKRREDAGAFFGSIHATLNHILWGDQIWMHRFADTPPPASADIPGSIAQIDDFQSLTKERIAFDAVITDWAEALEPSWLEGDLSWFSGAAQCDVTRPRAFPIFLETLR